MSENEASHNVERTVDDCEIDALLQEHM